MNSTQFTYWLKGFFEISDSKELTDKQVQIIKDHLNLVFTKVTPYRSMPSISPGNTTSDVNIEPGNPIYKSIFESLPNNGVVCSSSEELPPTSYC